MMGRREGGEGGEEGEEVDLEDDHLVVCYLIFISTPHVTVDLSTAGDDGDEDGGGDRKSFGRGRAESGQEEGRYRSVDITGDQGP